MGKVSFILFSMIFSNQVSANEICSVLLQNGVSNNFSTLSKDYRYQLFNDTLCSKKYSSYHEFASSLRNVNLGGSYADAILDFGQEEKSDAAVFKRKLDTYCQTNYGENEYSRFFDSKASTVSSVLVKGFNRCLELHLESLRKSSGIGVYVDVSPQSDFKTLTVRVHRKNISSGPVKIAQILPSSVSCRYDGQNVTGETEFNLNTFAMECKKPMDHQINFSISTVSEGPSNSVTIPAGRNRIYSLERTMERLLSEIKTTHQKTILMVHDNGCPEGWEDYKLGYGMFVRGMDRSGNVDPDGLRRPGNKQDESIGEHKHLLPTNVMIRRNKKSANGNSGYHQSAGGENQKTGIQLNPGEETRPKNVALLFCKKKGVRLSN